MFFLLKKLECFFSTLSLTGFWWGPMSRAASVWAQCPAHMHEAEPQQPRRAKHVPVAQATGSVVPEDHVPKALHTTPAPCSRAQHCQPGREQERQTQAATDPAAATRHGGKLRHDDFKHTSTGQMSVTVCPARHHNQHETQRQRTQRCCTCRHSTQRCSAQGHLTQRHPSFNNQRCDA